MRLLVACRMYIVQEYRMECCSISVLLSSGLRRHYTQVVVTITARVSNNGIHLSDSFFFFYSFNFFPNIYYNGSRIRLMLFPYLGLF